MERRRRIAVVGGGIAGMSAAYHLARYAPKGSLEVTLYEAAPDIGGHEMSVDTKFGRVDLGFMVLNRETYPNLLRFYAEHGIEVEQTDMGFAIDTASASWAFKGGLGAVFRLLTSAGIWRFLWDKHRFHADAHALLEAVAKGQDASAAGTLEDFCATHGYGSAFVLGWLQPLCEAVWSTPRSAALKMEASTILTFMRNHGFLRWSTIQWYTPKGRTVHTVAKFTQLFRELGVRVRCGAAVDSIRRLAPGGVELKVAGEANLIQADEVVIAAPAGVALKLLANPTKDDKQILSGFRCSNNRILLHTDPMFMPRDKRLWSSWNVIDVAMESGSSAKATLTYWVKPLQHVNEENLFISLNPPVVGEQEKKDSSVVLDERWAVHPVMDCRALDSQRRVHAGHQGAGNVWYAGAYLHYGFHEDGFRSGIEAARGILKDASIPLLPNVVEAFTKTHWNFIGKTTHARYNPDTGRVVHTFSYPLQYDYLPAAADYRRWWGGFHREDHFGTQESLDTAVREAVLEATGTFPTGAVDCITTLRVCGHAFNPITVYLCWDASARHRVTHLVAEVTNTPWQERTVQVLDLSKAERGPNNTLVMTKPKTLHVSPFNPTPDGDAQWRYTLRLPGPDIEAFYARIELFEDKKCQRRVISATMDLHCSGPPPGPARLLPPSLVTVFRIHLQAAILFLFKGATFHGNKTTQHTILAVQPRREATFSLLSFRLAIVLAVAAAVVAAVCRLGSLF